ncbi:MFS transporter [Homoserinibacter sp. YIM 151385]|uniref:MFS transporter n=1 Tax=Homoserinibacter sp. YIM 151385 TaxID=2985506 RepID=UPI0022EFFC1C|nr:MFS transporter [Homoserinibacter sp. YIM 151385]WBU37128.1 MFS transporter [Homoserinibacter sp. YIM 151385]
MFRSLGVFNYRIWFAGALVSNVGTWMQRTAQDWIVLTDLTDHDAAAVGVTMALQFAPQLLLVPVSGLIADRVDRRRMLLLTQSAMGLLALGLGILTVTGTATLLIVYGFALALGIVSALDAPARQTFVGELVPDTHLANAVALNSASFNGARLIGPAVAGLLTAAVGAGWVFMINTATFAAVVGATLLLRRGELRPATRAARERGQIRAGFRYVRGRPDILVIFAMVFLVGTFGMNYPIFASTMAVEFGGDAGEFGMLSSIIAIGSVTGALIAARRERPRLRIVVAAAGGFGLATATAALMPGLWSYAAVLVAVGFCSLTMMTSANAYVQTTTSPVMRGRVMALYMAIFVGGTPVGAPLVGWIANLAGPRWSMGVGALSGVLAAGIAVAWMMRAHGLRLRYDPDARLRLSWRYRGDGRDRELATQEIAVVEAAAQRG